MTYISLDRGLHPLACVMHYMSTLDYCRGTHWPSKLVIPQREEENCSISRTGKFVHLSITANQQVNVHLLLNCPIGKELASVDC